MPTIMACYYTIIKMPFMTVHDKKIRVCACTRQRVCSSTCYAHSAQNNVYRPSFPCSSFLVSCPLVLLFLFLLTSTTTPSLKPTEGGLQLRERKRMPRDSKCNAIFTPSTQSTDQVFIPIFIPILIPILILIYSKHRPRSLSLSLSLS